MTAHLTRAEPISVIARQQFGLNKESPDMIETNIVWRHPQHYDFTSYHIAGWCDPNTTTGMTYQDMQFIGSEGNIQSDQKKRGLEIVTDKGVEHPNPYFFNIHSKNMRSQYGMVSIETFIDAVQKREEGYDHRVLMQDLPSLKESKNVTKILEAADKSLATNKEVYL
jgi:predicted dehydrogenase